MPDDVVLAAHNWRTNGHLIADVHRLGYIKGRVYDATYGANGGVWWKVLFSERAVPGIERLEGNTGQHDFTRLPFDNGEWDTVAYDPPYKLNGNPQGLPELSERYGVDVPARWQARRKLMLAGFDECIRVTKPLGHLLVKCQDQVCSGAIRWQTQWFFRRGAFQVELVDRFDMLGHHIPQPMLGRTQKHAHGRPSTLLVFRKLS
jgi:hypothetical protein